MKRILLITLPVLGLLMCLWLLNQKQSAPLNPGTETRPVKPSSDRAAPSVSLNHSGQAVMPDIAIDDETWLKNHSADLVIAQTFDPESNDPKGTVTVGNLTIDLGETPPVYRNQLQASECPVMLGEKHRRRSYEIYATSLFIETDGITKKHPLHITYPRWPGAGIETSGGFVFIKDENPPTKIGVIVPAVRTPEDMGPGASELLEMQILIRVNDRDYVDAKTTPKLQSLDSGVVVLMPTHPDKIPTSSFVAWFKFEKDGTVLLLED